MTVPTTPLITISCPIHLSKAIFSGGFVKTSARFVSEEVHVYLTVPWRPCTVDGFSTIANATWLSAHTSMGRATGTPVMNSTKSRTKMTAWPTLDISTYSASATISCWFDHQSTGSLRVLECSLYIAVVKKDRLLEELTSARCRPRESVYEFAMRGGKRDWSCPKQIPDEAIECDVGAIHIEGTTRSLRALEGVVQRQG